MPKKVENRPDDLYATVSYCGGGGGGGGGGGRRYRGFGSRTESRGRHIGAVSGAAVGGAIGGRVGARRYGAAVGGYAGGTVGARIGRGMSDVTGTHYAPAGTTTQNYADRGTRNGYPQ